LHHMLRRGRTRRYPHDLGLRVDEMKARPDNGAR
jgi:hypothetical protein